MMIFVIYSHLRDEFFDEMEERKRSNPFWKYGGVRKKLRSDLVEPIPSRLRPRDRLKRKVGQTICFTLTGRLAYFG